MAALNDTTTMVILTPGFPADENDSTCLPAQQQFISALKKNFPRVHLIVLSFQYPYTNANYQWNGVTVISFNGRNKGKLHRLLLWRRVWKELQAIQLRHNISGIISFWYGECSFIGKRFADKHGIRHVCWILGQDARTGNRYVQRTGLASKEMVAMSDFLADEFEKNFSIRPGFVIPNGVTPSILRKHQKNIDVIGVGSLIELKRFNLFIDCIHSVRRFYPSIRAVICGQGPEKETLLQHIDKCSLRDHIFLMGEQDHDSVLGMLQRSKILLHPSFYEGFSTVCLEALAAGTRVLSFCKPMHDSIPGWYHASTFPDMQQKLLELLQCKDDLEPTMPYLMDNSAKKMMQLFSNQAVAKLGNLV